MAEATNGATERDILIVDDSLMSLRLLTQMLSLEGYHPRPVSSGPQAIQEAETSPPALILLDVMMPEMSGLEVAERLKATPTTQGIPIIFISALNDEESKVKALNAGGVDYITKPLQVNEVLARVSTHLRLRDANRRLELQLQEREDLIKELDAVNEQLTQEIAERKVAQEAREASLDLLQKTLSKTQALYRITRSLITSENISDMLQIVANSVSEALPADRVVIITLDRDRNHVTSFTKGGPGTDKLIQPSYEELMEGLTGWVTERVQPVMSPKDQPDPRESLNVRRRRAETECGAIMVAPLCYRGKMMGTMMAINRLEDPNYTEQQLSQLNATAGQVAIALANARLSEETAYLKEFNEGIVQGVAEAILLINQNHLITFANPAAATMLGSEPEALIGKPAPMLIPADGAKLAEDSLLNSVTMSARFETRLRNKEGERVPVLASIRPLYQEEELLGILVALTDITELKQAEQQLREYAADLEAQNAELDAFAHTVAHDLRSPLTGLMGFVDLVQHRARNQKDDDLQKYGHYLYRNSVKMNNIIDELLLLASVREVEEVDLGPLEMGEVVDEAYARLDYLIDEYDAEVVAVKTWPTAIGYGPWVEEVWVNYLSNAVKYGGRPDENVSPYVELGYRLSDHGNQPMVRFWVRDNGVGLTPEEQSQLFTPFERLHNVRAEGHGLGLSIVQRILEKLGGEVGVESQPGKGSTFYFTLPRASEERGA